MDWFGALSVNICFSVQKGKSKDDRASSLTVSSPALRASGVTGHTTNH